MPRLVSLNARRSAEAETSGEVEVVLIRITHPDLDAPVLLSTDPTERLAVDPLTYGTRSTWRGAGEPFLFLLASALLPDDGETPQTATLVLELLDDRMVEPLRAFWRRDARIDLAVVLASDPDTPEAEWLGLWLVSASGDTGEIRLTIGRERDDQEPAVAVRMTRDVAPGLHR